MWLMDNAAWKDTTHDVKGHTVAVPRGSVCVSERHIADKCGVGYQVVRTAIKRFASEQMINATPTHGKSLITLCNYSKYQDIGGAGNAEGNATPTQPQRNPNAQKEQGNKVTREEAKVSLSPSAKKSPTGSRISDDWVLSKSLGDWAIEKGAAYDLIKAEAEKFKDYWIGVAGAKGRKADWDATWRNWIRKAIDDNHKPQLKTINGGRNERPNNSQATQRPDPALEQILRLTGASATSSDGRL
jgi:hypothetical protein